MSTWSHPLHAGEFTEAQAGARGCADEEGGCGVGKVRKRCNIDPGKRSHLDLVLGLADVLARVDGDPL